MKKICLINNSSHTFMVHRFQLYKFLIHQGYDVAVIIPEKEQIPQDQDLLNANIHIVNFSRKGINPFSELITFIKLYHKLKQLGPDVLHNFTIKPVLYGTLIGRLLGLKKIVNSITGLGYIFTTQNLFTGVLRKLVLACYKLFFNTSSVKVIFQNEDDKAFIENFNVLNKKNCFLIYGSGVNTDYFKPFASKNENHPPVILCVSRLLKEKGLIELGQALKILNNRKIAFQCVLIGYTDLNFGSLTADDMAEWKNISNFKLVGYQKDVRSFLATADIFCLPSYREGLPMANLEAAAMQLPLVTTDAPGCKKTVLDGRSGFLVPIKDAAALADKLQVLIESKTLREKMGTESRQHITENFSSSVILNQIMIVYMS